MKAIAVLFIACSYTLVLSAQATGNKKTDSANSGYRWHPATVDGIGKFYLGREIAHVMGSEGSDWLERDSRQQEENTRLAIERIKLLPTDTIADIGAGTGYYSFRLAAKVPKGRVYAVDIQDALLSYLRNKKVSQKDSVVAVVKGTTTSPNLPPGSIGLAIMVDVYHELAYPHEMLQAIRDALKLHGKILLIEYRGEDASIPIKALHKTTVRQLNKELSANGFRLEYQGEFLPIQHFLLYEKE